MVILKNSTRNCYLGNGKKKKENTSSKNFKSKVKEGIEESY
jgi:hypothetical protein